MSDKNEAVKTKYDSGNIIYWKMAKIPMMILEEGAEAARKAAADDAEARRHADYCQQSPLAVSFVRKYTDRELSFMELIIG